MLCNNYNFAGYVCAGDLGGWSSRGRVGKRAGTSNIQVMDGQRQECEHSETNTKKQAIRAQKKKQCNPNHALELGMDVHCTTYEYIISVNTIIMKTDFNLDNVDCCEEAIGSSISLYFVPNENRDL